MNILKILVQTLCWWIAWPADRAEMDRAGLVCWLVTCIYVPYHSLLVHSIHLTVARISLLFLGNDNVDA